MPVWLVLGIYALATARLTGLITADEITRPVRDALVRRLDAERPAHRTLTYLLSCSWCCSLHVSAAVAPVAWFWGTSPWLLVPAVALAFSFLTGATSDLGRR
jgi:hypothetical protein